MSWSQIISRCKPPCLSNGGLVVCRKGTGSVTSLAVAPIPSSNATRSSKSAYSPGRGRCFSGNPSQARMCCSASTSMSYALLVLMRRSELSLLHLYQMLSNICSNKGHKNVSPGFGRPHSTPYLVCMVHALDKPGSAGHATVAIPINCSTPFQLLCGSNEHAFGACCWSLPGHSRV